MLALSRLRGVNCDPTRPCARVRAYGPGCGVKLGLILLELQLGVAIE